VTGRGLSVTGNEQGEVNEKEAGAGLCMGEAVQAAERPPVMLELVYGILFDPVKTCRRIIESPPLGTITVIFSLVKIFSNLMGGYLSAKFFFNGLSGSGRGASGVAESLAPAVAVFGLACEYLKWLFYSGFLHLTAELSGGRGRAAAIFAVTGLASVPALLFLPLNILLFVLDGKGVTVFVITLFSGLAVIIWGFVIIVIGLKEAHGFSAGRAVLVALLPALAIIFFILFALAGLAASLNNYF